jgi:hypothetical protein
VAAGLTHGDRKEKKDASKKTMRNLLQEKQRHLEPQARKAQARRGPARSARSRACSAKPNTWWARCSWVRQTGAVTGAVKCAVEAGGKEMGISKESENKGSSPKGKAKEPNGEEPNNRK